MLFSNRSYTVNHLFYLSRASSFSVYNLIPEKGNTFNMKKAKLSKFFFIFQGRLGQFTTASRTGSTEVRLFKGTLTLDDHSLTSKILAELPELW
jgi:hypothetical protein